MGPTIISSFPVTRYSGSVEALRELRLQGSIGDINGYDISEEHKPADKLPGITIAFSDTRLSQSVAGCAPLLERDRHNT
jgi:hypothetical protein